VSLSGASSLSLRTSAWLHDNVNIGPFIKHHTNRNYMSKEMAFLIGLCDMNKTSRKEEEILKRVSWYRECLNVVYFHPCRTVVVPISFKLRAARFPRINRI
jgi:hypothetical protein